MEYLVGINVKKLYSLFYGDTVVLKRRYRNNFKIETCSFNGTTRNSLCVLDSEGRFRKFKWDEYGFDWVAIEIHGREADEIWGET